MKEQMAMNSSCYYSSGLLVLLLLASILPIAAASSSSDTPDEIEKGFSISPPRPSTSFHRILVDPSGNFSLGFLFLAADRVDLAVLHLPSSFPLWRANANASNTASLSFSSVDGRLRFGDWSTPSTAAAARADDRFRLRLLDTSNLQIAGDDTTTVLWQSFDHPFDTIVQDQNFTSTARLRDADGNGFSARLGPNYLALYLFDRTMYWKQTALEARAQILHGDGPIYARINASSGYMGMYQREGAPVDVMPFDTFNRNVTPVYFLRLTLQTDGNLEGFYWNGTSWVPDYRAISSFCDLPTSCGSYALCTPNGTLGTCTCIDGENDPPATASCPPRDTADLCDGSPYRAVRRTGVDLAYKDYYVGSVNTADTFEECESSCERNCTCRGAVYTNATGACYAMDFPVGTMLAEGGEGKIAYLKVRRSTTTIHAAATSARSSTAALRAGIALLVVGLGVFLGIIAIVVWRKRRQGRFGFGFGFGATQGSMLAEGLTPLPPYRDLKKHASSSDFRSVELSYSHDFRSKNDDHKAKSSTADPINE